MRLVKPDEFRLLQSPWSQPRRELHIALAHELARAKVGDDVRQSLLRRLFNALPIGLQIACNKELRACRAAKRGDIKAVVC